MTYGDFNNNHSKGTHGTPAQRLSALLATMEVMKPKIQTNTEFGEVKDEDNVKSSRVL